MVTLNLYESVSVCGDCIWVFGCLRLILGLFMDFGVGLMSVRVLQVFYEFLGYLLRFL